MIRRREVIALLGGAGFTVDRNLFVEYRWAEGHYERFPVGGESGCHATRRNYDRHATVEKLGASERPS